MTVTLSPGLKLDTPPPISSMVPLNSWPKVVGNFSPVSGCGAIGTADGPDRYSWRSMSLEVHRLSFSTWTELHTTSAYSNKRWSNL